MSWSGLFSLLQVADRLCHHPSSVHSPGMYFQMEKYPAAITKIWYYGSKHQDMSRNTSVVLGDHFETFIMSRIAEGRYANVSEVIRAAWRLLDEEELRYQALRGAIAEGMENGMVEDIEAHGHFSALKSERDPGP